MGPAPYDLVAPILKKMSAKQLAEIEKKSPQIKAHSEEIWKKFLERDFGDRPMPAGRFRRTYIVYFKEKEAHLKDASIRLRESMERLKQEKAARTITSLEVDPMAAKARAKRKMAATSPAGSKLIQRAMQTARAKGPIHSNKNIKFSSSCASSSPSRAVTSSPVNSIYPLKRPGSTGEASPPKRAAMEPERERSKKAALPESNNGRAAGPSDIGKPKPPTRKVPSIFLTPKR